MKAVKKTIVFLEDQVKELQREKGQLEIQLKIQIDKNELQKIK